MLILIWICFGILMIWIFIERCCYERDWRWRRRFVSVCLVFSFGELVRVF